MRRTLRRASAWAMRIILPAVMLLAMHPGTAQATFDTFSVDTTVVMTGPGITLKVLAGSKADAGVSSPSTLTVSVASGDTFTLQYPGPNPGSLPSTGPLSLSSCNNVGGNNTITVTGPVTNQVFTPNTTPCDPVVSGGGGGGSAPTASVAQPKGGEIVTAGTTYQVFYSTSGGNIRSIRLSLSTDGGATYPSVIASGQTNTGFYAWSVPMMTATSAARLKIEAIGDGGVILATAQSGANFTINGTAPSSAPSSAPATPTSGDPTATGTYSPSVASTVTPTIDIDKGLVVPPGQVHAACVAGSLIKIFGNAAVYYCGSDGKRYVFPNRQTFLTWYDDFSAVMTISGQDMAKIAIGGNVTYRPGKRMVKIQTDPKVYVVSRGGSLRWVTSEDKARMLYGADWNKKIDDVPDSFFFNYIVGDPI